MSSRQPSSRFLLASRPQVGRKQRSDRLAFEAFKQTIPFHELTSIKKERKAEIIGCVKKYDNVKSQSDKGIIETITLLEEKFEGCDIQIKLEVIIGRDRLIVDIPEVLDHFENDRT